MRKIRSTLAFAILALGSLAAACGSDDDESPGNASGAVFSCTFGGEDGCIEYSGTGAPVQDMTNACTQGGGTPGTACSRNGAQGSCTIAQGGTSIKTIYYGLDADGLEVVKSACMPPS